MDKTEEVKGLANFLRGFSAGLADQKGAEEIRLSAEWLDRLSRRMCGQGFIGCGGGSACSSSHK